MDDKAPTILIVEDDIDVAEMLSAYFHVQGYDTRTVITGEECIQACRSYVPDVIILDIRLPDMEGFEVARRLRTHRQTQDTPIIFLTERKQRADRLQGLELGADDYITKPFDIQELRLRVRNALRRSTKGSINNPVTNLPERELVDEHLRECLTEKSAALLLVSLDNLDSFREAYGFVASDDVLRAISMMIQNAIRDLGSPTDFIGHFSPTQFIITTQEKYAAGLVERIRARVGQSLDYFYPLRDRQFGILPGTRLHVEVTYLQLNARSILDLEQLKIKLLRSGSS